MVISVTYYFDLHHAIKFLTYIEFLNILKMFMFYNVLKLLLTLLLNMISIPKNYSIA